MTCDVVLAVDAAQRIVDLSDKPQSVRIHRLLYLAQSMSLCDRGMPLFIDRIDAWVHGPILPGMFGSQSGLHTVEWIKGSDTSRLLDSSRGVIDRTVEMFGGMCHTCIQDLMLTSPPWVNARKGLLTYERGEAMISLNDMREWMKVVLDEC